MGCAAVLRPPIHKAAVPISESSTCSVDSDMAGNGLRVPEGVRHMLLCAAPKPVFGGGARAIGWTV